jgi:serine/threonine protein kinase/WD40 repeat protein
LVGGAPQEFCPKCLFLQASAGLLGPALNLSVEDQESEVSGQNSAVGGQSPGGGSAITNSKSEITNQFGDYELLEEIGCGGMGVVYRARQRSLDRVVAIKMMAFGPGSSPELVKRFRAEAVSAASLHHPNIVAIHGVGIHEDRHFFVMDYVEGQSLARRVGNQPLPAKRAAAYLKTIAEAIHYAHERGILHRDLKPSNVLIDAQDQPHVVDFGLARQLEGDSELTVTGQVLGSPQYLPPEQAAGQRGRVSRRTDVYALGATLYHLLTGRPPFQAESLVQTLDLVLHAESVAPHLLNPGVPRDLETICLKCLEKEPARRYPTAQALADELARFLAGEPIQARPLGPADKAWRWCRRKPQLASLAAVAALLFVLGFTGVLWQWRRADGERNRAEAEANVAQRNRYVLAIYSAQQALKANNVGRASALLDEHRPSRKPEADLRGYFEWRFLWQQCQNEAEIVGRMPGGIRTLEVSRDGRWLLAGSNRGAVKAWNLTTREEILLVPEQGWPSYATFSPDSRLVLFSVVQSVEPIGSIILWDIEKRERLTSITGPWFVGPMAFSRDGRWLGYGVCSLDRQRKILVRDFLQQTNVSEVKSRTRILDGVHGLAWVFGPDNQSTIFSENEPDCRIGLCSLSAPSEPRYFPGHREAITAIATSPAGDIVATGAGFTDTGIRLWDFPSFRSLGELSGHEKWITGLQFSPDGRTLASASTDQTVRLWDVATHRSKWVSKRLPQEVLRVCFSTNGQHLFSGSSDGFIQRWRPDAPQEEPHFWRQPTALESLTMAPSGGQFAGTRNGRVFVGEVQGDAAPRPIAELGTNNTRLLFSSDGQSLFAGTRMGEVQVWSFSRQEVVHRQHGSPEPISQLQQDGAGRILTAVQTGDELQVGHPCRITVWNVPDWKERQSWIATSYWLSCAVSPDGRKLAIGSNLDSVQVWALGDSPGTNSTSFPVGTVTDLTFSPDNRLLAAANREGYVHIWELPALRELPKFRAHNGAIDALTFSPDSRRLATAGEGEEAIRVWDVATWRELITLERSGETIDQISFSTDGAQLTARNSLGDLLVWRAPSWAQISAQDKGRRAR